MGNNSTDRGKEIIEFVTSPEYKGKPIYFPKYDIYFFPQNETTLHACMSIPEHYKAAETDSDVKELFRIYIHEIFGDTLTYTIEHPLSYARGAMPNFISGCIKFELSKKPDTDSCGLKPLVSHKTPVFMKPVPKELNNIDEEVV